VSRDIQDEERQQRFARNLRAARERARLTQAGLAKALGMTDEVYARYERAKMWPSIDRLCRLCEILDCSADELLGLDERAPGAEGPRSPDDPQPVRRLMRQLRKARPVTVRMVTRMLAELEKHAALSTRDDGSDRDDD
jgi:transcriptional regulator with XRE-family HTH domain